MDISYLTFLIKNPTSKKGFSLVELVLVIAVLAALFIILAGLLDPLGQIAKAKDADREHELDQLKNSLDLYYNDTGCYPSTLPLGGAAWVVGNTTYIKKAPQDPDCILGGTRCYLYQTDTSSCPQWNVLYGNLQRPTQTGSKTLCPLESIPNCLPSDYKTKGYNYCVVSGNVDCNFISGTTLPSPVVITPTFAPIGTATPVYSPTPVPSPTIACITKNYKCTSVSQLDPQGVCNGVSGGGDYCGYSGCVGNNCCDRQCTR